MKRSIVRMSGVAALALTASVAMSLPAQADRGVSTRGSCSDTSTYKVMAKVHKNTIVVKGKIKTEVAGETWTYIITDNGTTVVEGEGATNEDGNLIGSFRIPNLEGTDTIDILATDTVTGETCSLELVVEG